MSEASDLPVRRFVPRSSGYEWEGVERRAYKDGNGAPFRKVTRQTLFARDDLAGELRYFEVAPGGYSTLERHRHVHAVMILRGKGRALVGDATFSVQAYDLVTVAPRTWHQFRAGDGAPLGFLCMVDATRDRPELPGPDEIERLRANPAVAAFLR